MCSISTWNWAKLSALTVRAANLMRSRDRQGAGQSQRSLAVTAFFSITRFKWGICGWYRKTAKVR